MDQQLGGRPLLPLHTLVHSLARMRLGSQDYHQLIRFSKRMTYM
jgi:hypothetical protein